MYWVAVETSTATGSVALFDESKLVAEKSWTREGSHSEFLTDSFNQLLNSEKIQPSQISRVAVGVGPGSFTGVRVAVNFARAFSYSVNAQVYAIDSLQLLAYKYASLAENNRLCVLQFGFRDISYYSHFEVTGDRRLRRVGEICAVTPKELENLMTEPTVVVGSASTRLKSVFSEALRSKLVIKTTERDFPLASDFQHSQVLTDKTHLTDWIHTIPLYIRDSEAEEKLKRGELKSAQN